MKKSVAFIIILLFLLVAAGMTMVLDIMRYAHQPLSDRGDRKEVIIPPNQSFDKVLSNLRLSGLNISRFKFKCIARAKGFDKNIKAGEYVLFSNMSPLEIFDILVKGRERLYRLTIPEGYTLSQIAALVEQNGWDIKKDFLTLTRNKPFIKKLGIDAPTLEGYLFPDTYFFPKSITAEKMIAYMVDHFQSVFTPEWKNRAGQLGLTVHETVTLASIIEKETGAAFERPIISSVFHNRLNKGMRLESDPTVIYGIEKFDGNITRKDLARMTPYNTYKIQGLPPGPIANPGRLSIKAALYPSKTDYLFFVSKKDRTHHFSTDFKSHNKAVRKYQLGR